ncbi:hypothetical protein Tco_1237583 [Tanacetum coccineum]
MFIDSQFTLDYDSQMTDKYFAAYIGIEVRQFRETLPQHICNVKKSVGERTRHQRQYDRRVNKRQTQTQESKVDPDKALDADLVETESIRTKSEVQDENSGSGNDTDTGDADIRPIYDEEPMAEVQLTAECNIFATGQQHTDQPEIINEGRVDQYTEECQVIRKLLDSCMGKVNSEPPYGSNVDIFKIQKKQSIDISAELESLFGPLFDEYFNGENLVVSKSSVVTSADASNKRQQQPDSISSTSTLATTVTADGNFDL